MSVYLYCAECKSTSPIGAEVCAKCKKRFGRGRQYRVIVTFEGKQVSKVVSSLEIARDTEVTLRRGMEKGSYSGRVKRPPHLDDVWERFLPWAQEHKKSWQDDLLYYNRHIKPRFGNKTLDAITPTALEIMKSEMRREINRNGKPYSNQTIKHQLCIVRRLFNLARKWGMYQGANPVNNVDMPRIDNRRDTFLTDEEIRRLHDVLDSWPCLHTATVIRFGLYTGFRRSEIFNLKWDDVNFQWNMVTLRDPKGGITTTVPVSPEALEVLKSLPITSPYVFPGDGGGPRKQIRAAWEAVKRKAGLPQSLRYHDLRHSFATHLVSNGVSLGVVQQLLSHKNASTTERYAHYAPDAVRSAANSAGKILHGKKKGKKADVILLKK